MSPFTAADEVQARSAFLELAADGFTFLLDGYDAELPWADWLARVEAVRCGRDLAPDWVPATFLAARVGTDLVGRVSIRHELNPFLLRWGGHIGYAVRPHYRRRGYATAMLRASLGVAHDLGLDRVLVTCDDTNLGSAAVIERCGGVLDTLEPRSEHPTKRRYWVATT